MKTDQEINVAIAKACGWKSRPDPFYEDKLAWTSDEGATWGATCGLPDYCHDLNAMAHAESLITDDHWQRYRDILTDCTFKATPANARFFRPHCATAQQRAKAFLKLKELFNDV